MNTSPSLYYSPSNHLRSSANPFSKSLMGLSSQSGFLDERDIFLGRLDAKSRNKHHNDERVGARRPLI